MTGDHHGQLHAGSIGLFDDPDELGASTARLEAQHAIAASRALKQAEKQRGEQKDAKKRKYEPLSLMQRVASFLGLGRGTGREEWVTQKLCDEDEEGGTLVGRLKPRREGDSEERVYYDWEVDEELDSPCYRELGLVRIKARHGKDVKVVHKSLIRSSEPLADYGG